jgi:hypothetical protein
MPKNATQWLNRSHGALRDRGKTHRTDIRGRPRDVNALHAKKYEERALIGFVRIIDPEPKRYMCDTALNTQMRWLCRGGASGSRCSAEAEDLIDDDELECGYAQCARTASLSAKSVSPGTGDGASFRSMARLERSEFKTSAAAGDTASATQYARTAAAGDETKGAICWTAI